MLLAVAALVCASGDWYRPALYPYCDHAAGAGWAARAQRVRFDNPEINRLDVFRDAVPVYHAQRRPPPAESGLATWRTLPLTYARAPKIADAMRRKEVLDFLGAEPRDRYERVRVQRRFYDRMKDR